MAPDSGFVLLPHRSLPLLQLRVQLLTPSTSSSCVLFSVGLTGPQGPQGESLGHSRLQTPPAEPPIPAFPNSASVSRPPLSLSAKTGPGPSTVSLEKHLRKEKCPQNNLESHSGISEVRSCAICLHMPCSLLVQEFPRGGSRPRSSGNSGSPWAPQRPSAMLGGREQLLASRRRAQFLWDSFSVKVGPIVGPVHTHLDLRSCHHTQPQLLKLGIKEIKQRHKMKSSSRSPQKLSAQGCPSNARWWNSADKSKEEVLHQLQEAQPPLPYPAGARWGQWLLSWLLEAHNPEGLGFPKVKSMGLCFPRAQLLPHFPRRCS